MEVDDLEEVFTKVHHISLVPGNKFAKTTGSVGLVYHEPYIEDAVIFWETLLSYKGFDKAIIIDRVSIDYINLTLLIDDDNDALILGVNKVKCNPVKLDLFLKNHPADMGLSLQLKIHSERIEEVTGFDPALGVYQHIWIEKWKGKR